MITLLGCNAKPFLPCPDADFFWALAEAESGHNPKDIFEESGGNLSVGLYQLSIGDDKNYGVNCKFNSMEDLFDPVRNELCARTIVSVLHERHPALDYQKALGKYWAVLRGPKYPNDYREAAWKRFVAAAKIRGCIIE